MKCHFLVSLMRTAGNLSYRVTRQTGYVVMLNTALH